MDPLEVAPKLVETAAAQHVTLRILGGVAIWLHSPSARGAPFARTYADFDVVAERSARRKLDDLLATVGLLPDKTFNSTHGRERRIYYGANGGKADVFLGEFRMCHVLPLDERLTADSPTVPLAELFLSKAQIFELNDKDTRDLLALLLDHEVEESDADAVNLTRVAELCAADWGLWRTTTQTISALRSGATKLGLDETQAARLTARLDSIKARIDQAPKPMKWKMRDRVGDRVRWYELPDDPDRRPNQ